jgi:benzoate membrane transport protein
MTTAEVAPPGNLRLGLTALNTSIPILIFSVTRLSIVIAAANAMGLSAAQTTTLIVALYGVPGILTLVFAAVYRQPFMMGWSTPCIVFLASVGAQVSYPEILGALIVAGAVVTLIGVLGLSSRIAALIPAPIIFGLLAGMVLPFIVRIFNDVGIHPLMIGSLVVAFVAGRRLLEPRIPAIIVALAGGLFVAALMGRLNHLPSGWTSPELALALPSFSIQAILMIVPIIVVVILAQGNLPSIVYLESQDYRPPKRMLDIASGAGTGLGAFIGAVPVSMGSMVIPLFAGPDAGNRPTRHWAVYIVGFGLIVVALLASIAAQLPAIVPISLLLAVAGLALLPVLGQSLAAVTKGPLRLGPLFAFVVAISDMTLLGLGPLFWALVVGTGVSLLLETDELRSLLRAT